jgi:hypothetical protein
MFPSVGKRFDVVATAPLRPASTSGCMTCVGANGFVAVEKVRGRARLPAVGRRYDGEKVRRQAGH